MTTTKHVRPPTKPNPSAAAISTMPKRSKADASSPVRHIAPKYAAGATC